MEKVIIPTSNDHDQVIMQPVDKEPVIPADVIKDHPPRLSKNMQLSMRHLGKLENAIEVSEEWKYVDGEAVPPEGRDPSAPYTKADEIKYSDYGTIKVEEVEPFGPEDPASETCENIVVTDATSESNDDEDYVEAVPVMALDRGQFNLIKTEGRRGEVDTDPIDNENFLDRPGYEVKTSDTYMAHLEESESESESSTDSNTGNNDSGTVNVPGDSGTSVPTDDPPSTTEGKVEYVPVDLSVTPNPETGVTYYMVDPDAQANGTVTYIPCINLTSFGDGSTTYYTQVVTKAAPVTKTTRRRSTSKTTTA